MTSNGYNGWKNWQTWNVALWLGNDEAAYREMTLVASEKRELRQALGQRPAPVNAREARAFVVENAFPEGTPDMMNDPHPTKRGAKGLRGVHWPSIAQVINESIA